MTALPAQEDCRYCPNPSRVAAYSGALALHVVAFAFLMLPITYEHVREAVALPPPTVWVDIPKPPDVPAIPDPPKRVAATKPTVATTRPPVVTDKPTDGPVVTTIAPPDIATPDIVEPPPIAGTDAGTARDSMTVGYVDAPIRYPAQLIRRGVEGIVTLRVLVDREGLPARVELGRSSGVPDLDRAALSQVTKWRFRPAIKDGNPIEVWAIVPVKFSLDRG